MGSGAVGAARCRGLPPEDVYGSRERTPVHECLRQYSVWDSFTESRLRGANMEGTRTQAS